MKSSAFWRAAVLFIGLATGFVGPATAWKLMPEATAAERGLAAVRASWLRNCRIPDDCIDSKRYPLFMARAVLQELIESLQSTQGVKPC